MPVQKITQKKLTPEQKKVRQPKINSEQVVLKNKIPEKAAARRGKYFYGLGRRKTAIAKVKLFAKGSGKILVNQKEYKQYFFQFSWSQNLEIPFEVLGQKDKYDAEIKVLGGGLKSQSEASRLAISRCLVKIDKDDKKTLRAAGLMTRDPRAKERKKPGLKKARRAPQWSKR